MRVHSTPTQEGDTFACSRRAIDAWFPDDLLDWISFGVIGRYFEFDRRCYKRPKLEGTVVAAFTYCPDGRAYLCLYPVRRDTYAEAGQTSFAETVLPRFREWLNTKRNQAETAGSSHQEIIAEWTGTEHRFHELRALYIPS